LFQGDTLQETLASMIKDEPDLGRVPPPIQPLLQRCLAKDPKRRLRDIGGAMPLLDEAPRSKAVRRFQIGAIIPQRAIASINKRTIASRTSLVPLRCRWTGIEPRPSKVVWRSPTVMLTTALGGKINR
jgi:hypothetical protein